MRIPWMSDSAKRADAARRARARRRSFLAVAVLLSLTSLALWGNSTAAAPPAALIARLLAPIARLEDETARALTAGTGRFADLWNASSRLAGLRERSLALEASLLEQDLLARENEFLRRAAGLSEPSRARALPARVIGRNELGTQSLVVDRGRLHGVEPFDPVFRAEGAVGYVTRVLDHSGLVLLLTDRNARLGVSVLVDASAEAVQARTQGLPDGSHLLLQAKTAAPLPPGSTVVTSHLSTIFLPGVAVGRVETAIPSSSGLFDEYVVVPSADLQRLDWVLILTGTHRGEAVRLLESPPERAAPRSLD